MASHGSDAHRRTGEGRAAPRPGPGPGAEPLPLDRSLGGDLPCVVCRYSLRGLSIRSDCPECGTPVRATILSVVDPLASELQPIRRPTLVATGLILWTAAALAAALMAWLPQFVEIAEMAVSARPSHPDLSGPIVTLVLLSGLGALALVAPHRGLRRAHIAAAAGAVLLYVPLAWVLWRLGHTADTGAITGYLRGVASPPDIVGLRIAADGLIVLIVLGLRFNARVLVARSLALRQGRVDRQTLAAIAVAAAVAAAGDLVGLCSADATRSIAAIPALIAIGLVATGSALLTLGLAGAVIDSVRITRALRVPSPTLRDLLEPHTPESAAGPAAPEGIGGGAGVSGGGTA